MKNTIINESGFMAVVEGDGSIFVVRKDEHEYISFGKMEMERLCEAWLKYREKNDISEDDWADPTENDNRVEVDLTFSKDGITDNETGRKLTEEEFRKIIEKFNCNRNEGADVKEEDGCIFDKAIQYLADTGKYPKFLDFGGYRYFLNKGAESSKVTAPPVDLDKLKSVLDRNINYFNSSQYLISSHSIAELLKDILNAIK